MQQKYRVKNHESIIEALPDADLACYLEDAEELRIEYGLNSYSLVDIVRIYHKYSEDNYCAGWLVPNREHVEEAFCVTLEEIKEA